MLCPYCGKTIKDTSVFCGYCGEKITRPETEAETPSAFPDASDFHSSPFPDADASDYRTTPPIENDAYGSPTRNAGNDASGYYTQGAENDTYGYRNDASGYPTQDAGNDAYGYYTQGAGNDASGYPTRGAANDAYGYRNGAPGYNTQGAGNHTYDSPSGRPGTPSDAPSNPPRPKKFPVALTVVLCVLMALVLCGGVLGFLVYNKTISPERLLSLLPGHSQTPSPAADPTADTQNPSSTPDETHDSTSGAQTPGDTYDFSGADLTAQYIQEASETRDAIDNLIASGALTSYRTQSGARAYRVAIDAIRCVDASDVGGDYLRTFYFNDNGSIAFASYRAGNAVNEFYFHDGGLIRWRYVSDASDPRGGVNHDLEDSPDFLQWEETVTDDAYTFRAEPVAEATPAAVQEISMEHVARVTASSELTEGDTIHSAARIMDGSLEQAWVEGFSGQGLGESVTLYFDDAYIVSGFAIYAGYQKSTDLYYKNSRPASVRITFDDGDDLVCQLNDIYGRQEFQFGESHVTKWITFRIESVYPGSTYEDTVISELYVH